MTEHPTGMQKASALYSWCKDLWLQALWKTILYLRQEPRSIRADSTTQDGWTTWTLCLFIPCILLELTPRVRVTNWLATNGRKGEWEQGGWSHTDSIISLPGNTGRSCLNPRVSCQGCASLITSLLSICQKWCCIVDTMLLFKNFFLWGS